MFFQTGSGKTFTMGTGFDVSLSQHEEGIIPRAVHQLFQGIQSRRVRAQEAGIQPPEFKVSAQFLEVGAPLPASASACVGVVGWMLVHINSHQMGQNNKTGGISPLPDKQEATV